MDTEILFSSMEELEDWITEQNEEALFIEGFDKAIVGICDRYGAAPIIAYDRDKCIAILEKQICGRHHNPDLTSYEEAVEFFDFNFVGAYVGDNTPIFITLVKTV